MPTQGAIEEATTSPQAAERSFSRLKDQLSDRQSVFEKIRRRQEMAEVKNHLRFDFLNKRSYSAFTFR